MRIFQTTRNFLGKSPNFVNLRLSPEHTTDKFKFVIGPATRAGGLTDRSNWLAYRYLIVEVLEGRVSKIQAYRNYIKNSEFETRNGLSEKIFKRLDKIKIFH